MSFSKYPEYKDSGVEWLGKVPAHWAVNPLKFGASCNDTVLPESTDDDYEIEYVEISGVDEVLGITESSTHKFSAAPSRARRIVQDGDVLVSTVRTYLRAIAPVVNPSENLIVSTGFAVIRPGTDVLDGSFLGYLVRAEWWISEVISQSVGVSYPSINASDLMALPVAIPALSEQTQIARFLDHETARIDALIEEQQRLIELLKEKRQAVISHAVTKGLDPDVPMKDSGVEWLGKVPTHWEILPFFSRFIENRRSNKGMVEDNLLSLSYGRVIKKDINTLDGLLPESFETYQIIHPDDIVFRLTDLQNDKRSLRSAISEERGIITSAYLSVSTKNIGSRFSSYLFRAYDLTKVFYAMGGGLRQSMKYGDMKWMPILTPPESEQLEIARFLDQETARIDALVKEAESAIKLLQERRSSLISAAVTGKIDVRGWAAETVESDADLPMAAEQRGEYSASVQRS